MHARNTVSDDGLEWDDDTELTKISPSLVQEEAPQPAVRDLAYVILLAGNDVGKIFKLNQGETLLGRAPQAGISLVGESISRRHAILHLDGMNIDVEDLGSSNGTYVNGQLITRVRLSDGDKIRVGDTTILKFSFHDHLDESFQQLMYDAALRDGLTAAYNKRYFIEHLSKEIRFARRHNTRVALVMIDIDHFKRINDTHGHLAGDAVLADFGKLAPRLLRAEDVFARYGGEEFAILTRGITLEQAGQLAERLRAAVAEHEFPVGENVLKCTISLGVAALSADMSDGLALVKAADAALYAAKRAGRNCVLVNPSK